MLNFIMTFIKIGIIGGIVLTIIGMIMWSVSTLIYNHSQKTSDKSDMEKENL